MQELTDVLTNATRSVPDEYFQLAIDGGPAVYRERVYCYELYHQMRLLWPVQCRYFLNGEIDKRGHQLLAQLGADFAKPDFLVHVPGNMNGNYAIIEVKPFGAGRQAIEADLRKLALFLDRVQYQRAIYLLYGHGDGVEMLDRVSVAYEAMGLQADIEVWVHGRPGESAARAQIFPRGRV